MSAEPAPKKPKLDSGSKSHVLVMCAMAVEAGHLKSKLENVSESKAVADGTWPCTIGFVGNLEVRVVESGIGLAQAAAATAVHACGARPRAVLNYGCAGAHLPSLQPGDCILGREVRMVDSKHTNPDGSCELQGDRNFGNAHATCDPELLALAERAASRAKLSRNAKADRAPRIQQGIVASTETWCSCPKTLTSMATSFKTSCEDMEAAAIAAVCRRLAVPFLCVKDVANNEMVSATPVSELDNEMAHWVVSAESAAITYELLRLLESA